MSGAEWVRRQMGRSTLALMDLADEEVAQAMLSASEACGRLDMRLRARHATVSQRASVLIGAALGPVVSELERREERR